MDAGAYIDTIAATVEAYKDVRDSIDKTFNEDPRLPSTNLAPVGGQSDEENLEIKRGLYQWSTAGGYPPFLFSVPPNVKFEKTDIFDKSRLQAVDPNSLRTECGDFFESFQDQLPTMATIENKYVDLHKAAQQSDKADVYKEENVGLRPDWFTDAVFAQQHFTGVNPTGLKQASAEWITQFVATAAAQKSSEAQQFLSSSSPESLYVVDNSDYREILGLAPDAVITAPGSPSVPAGQPAYGCAAVTLFSLPDSGKLHPIAICLDYKGSMASSVTIFNKRLTADAQAVVAEKDDWPWRYAKMCSMTSDWTRHELAVHLTETHLLEEALIVAAQRNLPDSHIVCELLRPHWLKTLSLNDLARKMLVPVFIEAVAPFKLPQIMTFIKASYTNFDFVGQYAPTQLRNRGFDPSQLDDHKFHNYLYARNISKIWDVLRSFVSDVLRSAYPNDADVAADKYVAGFCTEMRSQQGGQLDSFPEGVETLDELIDLVTMCIHIAAPQHNAINYLQQFYLSFVPNRPASFAEPLPADLATLQAYTETNVVGSLPIQGYDVVEWMLMAQVPYLLSSEVAAESNIEEYAAKPLEIEGADGKKLKEDARITAAKKEFHKNIQALNATFEEYNMEMDDQVTEYHVLDPKAIARSILI